MHVTAPSTHVTASSAMPLRRSVVVVGKLRIAIPLRSVREDHVETLAFDIPPG